MSVALPSAYAVIVSRTDPLDPHLLDGIGCRSAERLPFDVSRRLCWTSDDALVAVLAFAGDGVLTPDLPWDVSRDGVITHSGFPLPRLGAVFTTLALDDRGTGTLTTDPLGVGVLYRADGPDRTAIASRASLAGISAGHPSPLRRSVEALGWLLSFDNIVGNGTGFEGVLALPARSLVRVTDDRRVTVERRRLPCHPNDPDSDVTSAADELRQRLECVAGPDRRLAGLTAGRDSRVLLAHILDLGLRDRFRFVTWDLGGDDVRVAARLALEHGLDHVVVPVETVAALDHVDAALRWTDGMLPATEAGRVFGADEPFVSGIGGGLATAVYGAQRQIDSVAHVEATLIGRVRRRDDESICTRQLVEQQANELEEIVRSIADDGWTSGQILPLVFLDQRLHRWQGTVRDCGPRADIAPLLAPEMLTAGLALAHEDRRRFTVHRRLIERARPHLLVLPFGSSGGQAWMAPAAWPATARLIGEELFADRSNPVFELVSWDRASAYVTLDRPPPAHVAKQLVNAVALARWAALGVE